jgi:hypothetical protein
MRLKFILIFVLLTAFQKSNAQLIVGAFGGINMSKMKGDVPKNAKYHTLLGMDFGIMLDLKISDQVTLSLQPSFSQKGTKMKYTVQGEIYPVDSIKIRINYLAIPFLVKIAANNKRFYAIGGIEAGFPLAANAVFKGVSEEENLIDHISSVNVVMHFGIGYRIPLGKPNLFIEGRYLQSLNNTVTEESPDYNFFPRVRTTDFQFLVGIEIPIFK